MEPNAVMNSQYIRRETSELNPVSVKTYDNILEAGVCKAILLTGVNMVSEDLQACHQMKKLNRVVIKSKSYKQKQLVMYKRKNLGTKSQELLNLKFSGRL